MLFEKAFLMMFVALIATFYVVIFLRSKRHGRLRRVGKVAVADVMDVSIERILGGSTLDRNWWEAFDSFLNERKYTYTFLYQVDGVHYTRMIKTESTIQRFKQGESVEILYNPENPKEIMTAAEGAAPSSVPGSFILVSVLVLAMVLFFLLRG